MQHPPTHRWPLDLALARLEYLERQLVDMAANADANGMPALHDDLSLLWVQMLRLSGRLGAKGSKYTRMWATDEAWLQLGL